MCHTKKKKKNCQKQYVVSRLRRTGLKCYPIVRAQKSVEKRICNKKKNSSIAKLNQGSYCQLFLHLTRAHGEISPNFTQSTLNMKSEILCVCPYVYGLLQPLWTNLISCSFSERINRGSSFLSRLVWTALYLTTTAGAKVPPFENAKYKTW